MQRGVQLRLRELKRVLPKTRSFSLNKIAIKNEDSKERKAGLARWITKDVIENAHNLCYHRFERYFNNTLLEEQLILNYDHDDFFGDKELNKEIQRITDKINPEKLISRLYTVDKPRIPTYPEGKVTPMLLEDRSYINISSRNKDLPEYRRGNFLDPTYLGGGHLKVENDMPLPRLNFLPKLPKVLKDIPIIEYVSLQMPYKHQIKDPVRSIKAKTLLYLISGVNVGNCSYKKAMEHGAKRSFSKVIGARTTITGPEAYSFLDKTVNIVMPTMSDWDGLTPFPGEQLGTICFMIPSQYTVFYPDIYSIRNNFSEFFDLHVTIKTSTTSTNSAATLISAFQFPFINNIKYSSYTEVPPSITNPTRFRGGYLYSIYASNRAKEEATLKTTSLSGNSGKQ